MNKDTFRWTLKKVIQLFPQKTNKELNRQGEMKIVYLFSGTYGDFVQCLEALKLIKEEYPKSQIYIKAPFEYLKSFSFFLPEKICLINKKELLKLPFQKADLLFTNVLGVYRSLYDWIAYWGSVNSYGFCYGDELHRKAYGYCIRVKGIVRNYTDFNLDLIKESLGYSSSSVVILKTRVPQKQKKIDVNVLFHIGSQGIKKKLGLVVYCQLLEKILLFLKEHSFSYSLIVGPGDGDIISQLKKQGEFDYHSYDLLELKEKIKRSNVVLCFDSFMPHFCYFLNKPALVLHHKKVPSGYNCAPLHKQIVLTKESNPSLMELFQELESENEKVLGKRFP